jgi:hypothetical protein
MKSRALKGNICLEHDQEEIPIPDEEWAHREITQEVRNKMRRLGLDPEELIF